VKTNSFGVISVKVVLSFSVFLSFVMEETVRLSFILMGILQSDVIGSMGFSNGLLPHLL